MHIMYKMDQGIESHALLVLTSDKLVLTSHY